jgi:hypothetical protein
MANSNNICTRFINYVAVLILVFLSSQSFASGGSFSGGCASGSWDSPQSCDIYQAWSGGTVQSPILFVTADTPSQACSAWFPYLLTKGITRTPGQSTNVSCITSDGSLSASVSKVRKPGCEEKCPAGYEKDANGKCQPKKCPVGQTLVNGQCKQKQCPAGQALDKNGQCFAPDDQCPAGQKMVNGRCKTPPPDDPNDPDDPNSELPPFCEWASVMCQWHEEWQQWSNDYAANEEKANLDREELKRLSLDSKEQLVEINSKQEAIKQAIQNNSLTLEQVKQQDKQFYDELRLWLDNFDSEQGSPSEQYPPVQFPVFCDWSVQVCNWYLDWKDWRTDYNANNDALQQKLDLHLQRLQEIKDQDEEHYEETKSFFNLAGDFFDETLTFFEEIRAFLDQQESNQANDNTGDITPEEKNIQVDETQRITFVNGCPAGEQFTVSFMGSTQNLEFSYQPLCQFMSMIRPFVIAIAYLIGAYIVMGLSRGSSE